MAKIKKFNIFDIAQVKRMISVLSSTDLSSFTNIFWLYPLTFIQHFLHIRLKKLPESYVSIENKQLNGMITVQAERGNPYKWNIIKLLLDKNSNEAGRQLVDYVTAKYGAKGANTFCVVVDDSHEEILTLFSKGCGFRLCSHENLWKMDEIKSYDNASTDDIYRPFKNSDAKYVCELYNDSIYPHFRYSLAKTKAEFYDRFFQGFSSTSSFKYVVDDARTKRIKAYIEIQTNDNTNYILDIVLTQPYEDLYPDLINFAINQIERRKKDFYLFILNKKYQSSSKKFEDQLKLKGFSLIQTQMVLVKDFFKPIKQGEKIPKPAIFFSEIKGKPAFNLDVNNSL